MRVRTSKPHHSVGLNTGHPGFRGLRYAMPFNDHGTTRAFNDSYPSTLADFAGVAQSPTFAAGATWAPGRGVKFANGTTSYISTEDGAFAARSGTAGDLTLIARVFHDGGAGTLHTIVGANRSDGYEGGISIYREATLLSVWQGTGASASTQVINGAGVLTANTWFTVAVRRSYDGANYNYATWINGAADDTGAIASAPFAYVAPNRIGFAGDYTGAPWSGFIDWLFVWNRALSAAEVQAYSRNIWRLYAMESVPAVGDKVTAAAALPGDDDGLTYSNVLRW